MTDRRLHLLLVEDSVHDADLIARALEHGGYALEYERVESDAGLREALARNEYDLAITDHALPGFGSASVLATLAEMAPDLPCVLVSGKVGEEAVGAAMRQGAVDYVAKESLGRLPAAVERTLAEQALRRARHATEEALARSGRLFEAVFVNTRDAMLILDDERRLLDANPAAAEMFGLSRDALLELDVEDLMPEAVQGDAPRLWNDFLHTGRGRGEVELVRPDGDLVAAEYSAAANFVRGRHIIVLRDIRKRRLADAEALRHSAQQEAIAKLGERALREENLDLLMQDAAERVSATLGAEIVTVLELRSGERTFVVRAETGLAHMRVGARVAEGSEPSAQPSYTVRHGNPVLVHDYAQEERFDHDPMSSELGVRSGLSVQIPGDLSPFGVLGASSTRPEAFRADDASFMAAVANILADALKRARNEAEMRELALHDSLTGLPNRTLFFDRLTLALARTSRLGTRLAVLFLDVDHFKSFNDTLGHRAADRLLTQVGARIERTMRETDTVARFGGDEFVVLCEDLTSDDEAEALSIRLDSAFDVPFSFDDERHELSASIGVAMSDPDNLDGEALLRDADIAMYRSKQNGRAMWTLATEEMRDAVVDRFETRRALAQAIEADELVLHFQPIVILDGGDLCGVEALVRWEDPQRGLIPPGQFIPLAEETGLILRLGEWVLREACRQAAHWRVEFGDEAPLPIHVNFSARQVAKPDLPQVVGAILEETGAAPCDIALEITEGTLIDSLGGPVATLAELKRLGVSIVLDDFGTGYSSLSYLEHLPIDVLKIDRAFVSALEGPSAPAPIVTAIVGVARALAVGTVAEGVETAEQTAAVTALGCTRAQGYFFARPGPAEGISALVRDAAPLRERAAEAHLLAPPAPGLLWPGASAEAATDGPVGVEEHRQAFLAALLAVDSHAAEQVVYSALSQEVGPEIIDARVIAPAMIEIGVLWERGEVTVAQEHLATGISSHAAGLAAGAHGFLTDSSPVRMASQSVMLANVDGDDHVLGLRMAADVLGSLGADVRYLGSKVPQAELCDAASQAQPEVIGLSMTMLDLAPRLLEQMDALRIACPDARLIVGGQGASSALAARGGATFVSDVEELVAAVADGRMRKPVLVGT